jgi:acetyl-CoA carboxylase biotin carboxylase subunit
VIRRVLVANRGEIAVRVIASCRAAGVEAVAVYSDGDRDGLWTRIADRAVCIGPARASDSYLSAAALVTAAKLTGCDAVHPGYGFLSENAAFSALCADEDLTFIGPSPDSIAKMGNKIAARRLAQAAGVPTVPGSEGRLLDWDEARGIAERSGYPLLLKAAAGGGGRGMRVVRSAAELRGSFAEAQAEARAAFGDDSLYAERFLEGVRHIEVQILGDGAGKVVHLGERDCSLQRRSQKLLEEAPAVAVPPSVRGELCTAAVELARAIDYRSLGTIEFVYEPSTQRFYFLEMNTRIQVEHPVTEMVTGLDLVAEQLRIAAGEPLRIVQKDVALHGHAIECRINAEDPRRDFRPSPARITAWIPPRGPGVRLDTHAYAGYTIPPFYDSMIAKLIVHGRDRDEAIARARAALAEYRIEGPKTTCAFHAQLLADRRVIENRTDTKWIEREYLPEVYAHAS